MQGEESRLDEIKRIVFDHSAASHHFTLEGEEESNLTDQQFKDLVTKGKQHCQRGDVFQIVLSRRYTQKYPKIIVSRVLSCDNLYLYL